MLLYVYQIKEVLILEKNRNPPCKSKYFCCVLWPDSSTYNVDKIIKSLAEQHLTFAISPIHNLDVEDNGSPKKNIIIFYLRILLLLL